MHELELLQQKLDQLLKRFASALADKERLEKTIAQQLLTIEQQQERIDNQEEELRARGVADSAYTDRDREKLKKHLDKVIQAIEKNIELL